MKKILGILLVLISIVIWCVYFLMQFPNFLQTTDLAIKQDLKVLLISVSLIAAVGISSGYFLIRASKSK